MDLALTCTQASQYLNDRIDNRLDAANAAPLDAHLAKCGRCRLELSFLEGSRATLRRTMAPAKAPESLRRLVLNEIRGQAAPVPAAPPRTAAFFSFSTWRIPMAFAGAIGLALIAYTVLVQKAPHNHTRPFDGSVITESFNNFDQVLDGTITPAIVSPRPTEVKSFLEARVHFPIQVPAMQDYRLVGGQFSTADDETTAHVIYERNGTFIYLSQSDARKLIGGKRRFIPKPALDDMERSGWFFAGNVDDCNLAMWLADSTLCTAVGDVHRRNLLVNIGGVGPR